MRSVHQIKSQFISDFKDFAFNIVRYWNPSIDYATKMIIPPVSSRDEIKTDGYGMALFEMLEQIGIIIKKDSKEWILNPEKLDTYLLLCVDGLSLDRHSGFQRKLLQVSSSSISKLKHAMVFKNVFKRII